MQTNCTCTNSLNIGPNETTYDYKMRLCFNKDDLGLSWRKIAKLVYDNTKEYHDESYYRRKFGTLVSTLKEKMQNTSNETASGQLFVQFENQKTPNDKITNNNPKEHPNPEDLGEEVAEPVDEDFQEEVRKALLELKKERYKLSEERTQTNALIRAMAREETLKEIAKEVATSFNERILLQPSPFNFGRGDIHPDRAAVLQISDWHYGIDVKNYFTTYNPEITKQMVAKLRDEVLKECFTWGVRELYVCDLGDMIAGRIHLKIRLNSRFDVITQQINISELIAEFLYDLATTLKIPVHYYNCIDNHSRIEPNKKEAIQLETLARMTPWHLHWRFKDLKEVSNVIIHENEIGPDIMSFNVFDWKFMGVHGDKDKVSNVTNLSMFTKQFADVILMAHNHHFIGDEKNKCLVVGNCSLSGVDDLAYTLRLSNIPAQNLILTTPTNPVKYIARIVCE